METPNMLPVTPGFSPPAEIATRRTSIFGMSGSGKSNSATRIMEELLAAGEQIVLIDPKGEGWGLRSSADGRAAGFDVIIFGQPHGDIADLRVEHADQLADFVVDSGRSVIFSLQAFDSDEQERKFVTAFFKRFYRRKSQQSPKTRTLVVLEEAHLFIPEHASGRVGEMVGAIKRIARQGRSAGIGLMLVDQRPADVANSVITQSELLICHQLAHRSDRDALTAWVKAYASPQQGKEFFDTLAQLEPGEAWIWSPAWLKMFIRLQMTRRRTYDSGATPDGEAAAAPAAKAPIDLGQLRRQLADVVKEAEQNDPDRLRARIEELTREVAALEGAPTAPPPPPPPPAITAADLDWLGEKIREVMRHVSALPDAVEKLRDKLNRDLAAAAPDNPLQAKIVDKFMEVNFGPEHMGKVRIGAVSPPDPTLEQVGRGIGLTIPRGEGALLAAFRLYTPGAGHAMTRKQLGIVTGYKKSSRDAYIQRLIEKGLMLADGAGLVALTPAGWAAAPAHTRPPAGKELREFWLNRLPTGEATILGICMRAYPSPVGRDQISAATEYKKSSRDAYIQRLAARNLITTQNGRVKAAAELYHGPAGKV